MKTNVQWFKDQFQKNNLSQRKVAASLKLDPGAITLMLQGKRQLKLSEANEIANLLGQPLEEVLTAAGIRTGIRTMSSQSMKLSGWVDGEFNIHWESIPGSAPVPNFGPKKVVALRLQTIGSSFEAVDGALVYAQDVVKTSTPTQTTSPDSIGRLSLVKLRSDKGVGAKKRESLSNRRIERFTGSDSNQWVLGVLKRGYNQGQFKILGLNGELVHDEVQVEAAVPVLWMKL